MKQFLNVSRRYLWSTRVISQVNLTFFTKDTCMLCTNAKNILHDTLKSPDLVNVPIKLTTIDIMDPKNQEWFDKYCYDVPVLHVDRPNQPKPVKFMHYFYEDKLKEEFTK
ncbi:hypothetical protein Cantr_06625 [Candida viswanathii]|uniref:Glutaredoxin-like protein n=1 Tax=Candida viswanathii TaxID=5486 RepID=A0A367XX08_9ASCO|nr:hypothetical protein Cantr_06625 [Candida viswanathii]